MKKQLRTVIIAVVLFGALFAAYLLAQDYNRKKELLASQEETHAEETVNLKLLERQKDDLVSVSFLIGDDTMVFLPVVTESSSYNRIEWVIEGYEDLDIEKTTLDSMVTPVYYFSPIEQLDPTDDNLAEFGLENPSVTVTGHYADGSTETVYLGKSAPGGDYFYAKLEGTPGVYLLYDITGKRFFNRVNDLVKMNIPGVYLDSLIYAYFYQRDVYELEVGYDGTDEEMEQDLERYGMVLLSLIKPYPGRDLYFSSLQAAVLEKVESITLSDVVEVYPEDLSIYGLDDPEIIMHLIDGELDEYHIFIGNDASETHSYVMLASRPVVYTVQKDLISMLYNVNILKLVEKFVALVNIVTVDKIEIESTDFGRSHEIYMNHDIFTKEDDPDYEEEIMSPEIDGKFFEEPPFKTFYQSLIALAYDVEIFGYEIKDEPAFTVRYILNDGKPDVITRYYPYNNDFYAVQRDDHPVQFIVSKRSVATMFNTMDRLFRGEIIR